MTTLPTRSRAGNQTGAGDDLNHRADPGEDVESDESDDFFLNDGTPLRTAIEELIRNPDPWRVPGGDVVDTLVALIGAVAPHLVEHERYGPLINHMSLDEHCKGLLLAWPAPVTAN